MNLAEIKKKQQQITYKVIDGHIASALPILSELAYKSHQGDFINSLGNLEETYKNILKYSFSQTKDPQRETIYNNLKRQLIELSDNIVHYIARTNDDWLKGLYEEDEGYLKLSEREKTELIDELATEREFSALMDELDPNQKITKDTTAYLQKLNKVFEILLLKGTYNEGEIQLATRLLGAAGIPWYEKSLIVSAISISLLNHFDLNKISILFDTYLNDQKQVSQRALVGVIFALLIYHERLKLYPEVTNRIKTIDDPKKLAQQTEQILIQLIKSQETEKVTEKIQKEIIPEVMKLKPDIEEKLKLDELLSKDEFEDKNPDWENFFSDSPDVYKKLEEFSSMQMDGSDVFMGAFSMLKRFGFFEQLSNWFLPFYQEHPEIQKATSGVDDKFDWKGFFEGIEKAPVMCNSDKYSFCFNIGFMPDMQKSMMLDLFSMELKQMSELSEDEKKHNAKSENRIIFTQYIQDLYRFFKLHPKKSYFVDVFDIHLDISATNFLKEIFYSSNSIRAIGEFYFNKNYYTSALRIFENLKETSGSFELIEKTGFCYQKLEMYSKAIEKYQQAEMFETNRSWLNKKLGYCYRKLGEFDKAIEYYKKVEHQEPENIEIQAYLGQLNIDREDYNEALKYYFKVEYQHPDSVKVQRPIGWCYFLLQKKEQAIRYLKKVVDKDGHRSDYLNLGHAYWVNGQLSEAIESYRMALKHSGNNTQWFTHSMLEDASHLKAGGIDELEIALMTDYLILDT